MRKLFFTAALALIVSAFQKQWSVALDNADEPRELFNEEGKLVITQDWSVEVAYKVFYANELDGDDDGVESDVFGVKVFSTAATTFYFSILDYFDFEIAFELIPFEICPLKMGMYYTRPSALLRGDD